MGAYLLRRLLLMPVTLVGITLLVFMLVALSPGGIGDDVDAGGGGDGGGGVSLAEIEHRLYLEDRYGLHDPALVQYGRWLRAVCPLKFGPPEMLDRAGEVIRHPRQPDPPPLWRWWADALPQSGPAQPMPPASADEDAPERAYRDAVAAHARASALYAGRRADLVQALRAWALPEIPGSDRADSQTLVALIESSGRRPLAADLAALEPRGRAALDAYAAVLDVRADLLAAIAARPFPDAGVKLLPGLLSLGWPDLGASLIKRRPVLALMRDALPITLLLNAIAFTFVYAIAIPSGMLAAVRRGRFTDRALGLLFVALWSVPTVWAGALAIGFLASRQSLGLFPVSGMQGPDAEAMAFLPAWTDSGAFEPGWLLDALWHLCLPAACLTYAGFAVLAKQTRSAVLENLQADYVRTARAKGAPPLRVLLHHVMRNSLLPLITMFAGVFPAMLSGSVVVEKIFSVPGMGSLMIDAIQQRDREVLLGVVLVIGVVNLVAMLLADILYAAADPRVAHA